MALKSHTMEDVSAGVRRNAIFVTIKEFIIGCFEGGAAKMLASAGAFLAGASEGASFLALLGVSAIGASSAFFALMEGNHKINDLTEDYAEEIAAKLGKKPQKVTAQDLELVAKGDPSRGIAPNHVLAEQLDKQKRNTMFGIAFSVAATLGAMFFAPMLVAAIPGLLGVVHAGGLLAPVITGMASVIMYHSIKTPLHGLADKLFHIDEQTTAERIRGMGKIIHNGHQLSQEQVLGVYVSADEKLAQFIRDRFGSNYDDLSEKTQQQAVTLMSRHLPLDSVTTAINQKRLCVTELAFLVQGDASGIKLDEWHDKPTSMVERVFKNASRVYETATLSEKAFAPEHGLSSHQPDSHQQGPSPLTR